MNKLGAKVLSAQAGYPEGAFRGSYDPAMGRGYRAGDQVIIPAGESRLVVNHGLVSGYFRWKVSLNLQAPPGVTIADNTAYFVRVTVTGKNENDEIPRETEVGLGNGQVIYVPGRSLEVMVENPTEVDLELHYSLDEATPGLSSWRTSQLLSLDAGTPVQLDIPAFTHSLEIKSLTGGPGFILRGYNQSGTLVYDNTVSSPESGTLTLLPSLRYTLEATLGAGINASVLYHCVG